jgi:hypothetical protein
MLWNDIQQYFIANPSVLIAVYGVGYLLFVFLVKTGKDNAQFAMLLFKILYYTVGLPLLVLNSVFKFLYKIIFKRPFSSNTSKASAPNIVIDNPEVQIIGIRPNGRNNWTVEVRTRSDANTSLITGVGNGNESGNGFVNGEKFNYRSYAND